MKPFLVIFIVIFCINLQAAPTCSENGTAVIYTNGVNTKDSEAQAALREIKKLGLSAKIDAKKVVYLLKYNFHGDGARDLMESAIQRFPQQYLNSIKVDKWEAFIQFISGKLQVPNFIAESIQQAVLERTLAFIKNRADIPTYEQTVIDIADAYSDALDGTETSEKMRVLAISHSQGGLFMNDAYELLNHDKKLKYFAGFQIATPGNEENINHFGYKTHSKDRLIAFIRSAIGALSANMTVPLFVNNVYNSAGDYLIDFVFNHGITTTYLYDDVLKPQIISALIETAQKLESNCSDKLPKIKISYDSQNPYKLHFDATELASTIPGAILTGSFKWSWGDGSENKTTVGAIATHVYPQFLTYEGILEIPLATGTIEVPFVADLARFTGQTSFLNSNLGLNSNGESPVQSAIDLENNLYYFATNTGKLVSLNATTGAQVSMLPLNFQNIKWMSVTSDGDIALVDNSVFGIFTYKIVDPETGETLLSKLLTDENISNVEGFALDVPRNIFYYSIPTSDFSATLVALNSNTGTEFATSSNYYYGGPIAGDNTIRLVSSSVLINSDGWLIRNGGIYPAAPLGMDNANQYQGLIARWDPVVKEIVTTEFPNFFNSMGPMPGIDNNKDVLYTFWGHNDFSGSSFVAINSKSGEIVYSIPATDFSPNFFVENPQVTSDGHMVGTAYVCAEAEPCFIGVDTPFCPPPSCTYQLINLLRTDDLMLTPSLP